jgi:hypothetical protein
MINYFLDISNEWEKIFGKITANNNFKCMIKYNKTSECYFWATEWNQSNLQMGFFGNNDFINHVTSNMPLKNKNNGCIRLDDSTYLLEENNSYKNDRKIFV